MKFKNDLIKEYAKTLIKNGFKVYYSISSFSDNTISYLLFEKDNNLGYTQVDYFGGLTFSTIHKPSKDIGTGYLLQSEGISNPTIQNALDTFINKPHWAKTTDNPIKYNGFEGYLKEPIHTILKYKQIKRVI